VSYSTKLLGDAVGFNSSLGGDNMDIGEEQSRNEHDGNALKQVLSGWSVAEIDWNVEILTWTALKTD
jgi:hypothetical protein